MGISLAGGSDAKGAPKFDQNEQIRRANGGEVLCLKTRRSFPQAPLSIPEVSFGACCGLKLRSRGRSGSGWKTALPCAHAGLDLKRLSERTTFSLPATASGSGTRASVIAGESRRTRKCHQSFNSLP